MIRYPDRFIVLTILGYLITITLAVFVIDWSVQSVTEDYRTIILHDQSDSGLQSLQSELVTLQQEVKTLETDIAINSSIRYPSLQDIEGLANKRSLTIHRIERINPSADLEQYRLILHGRISREVAFLRELKTEFILESSYITTQPINEDGTVIALNLQMGVSGR